MEALSALSELPGVAARRFQFVRAGLCRDPGKLSPPSDFLSIPLLGVDEERGSWRPVSDPGRSQRLVQAPRRMGGARTLQQTLERLAAPLPPGVYFDCAKAAAAPCTGFLGLDLD